MDIATCGADSESVLLESLKEFHVVAACEHNLSWVKYFRLVLDITLIEGVDKHRQYGLAVETKRSTERVNLSSPIFFCSLFGGLGLEGCKEGGILIPWLSSLQHLLVLDVPDPCSQNKSMIWHFVAADSLNIWLRLIFQVSAEYYTIESHKWFPCSLTSQMTSIQRWCVCQVNRKDYSNHTINPILWICPSAETFAPYPLPFALQIIHAFVKVSGESHFKNECTGI